MQTEGKMQTTEHRLLLFPSLGPNRKHGNWSIFWANLSDIQASAYWSDIRELKHVRFWDTNGNDQKWAIFTFNLASHKQHDHIQIAKNLFYIRD